MVWASGSVFFDINFEGTSNYEVVYFLLTLHWYYFYVWKCKYSESAGVRFSF